MHINEIKIMQRKNLGNYEHREVTMSVAITEGEDFNKAYELANLNIKKALGYEAEAPAPAPKKNAGTKRPKKAAVKKEPVVIPTLEEMMALCRDTANRLKSAEKVKALMSSVCGVETLKDANEDTFAELKTKLNDAK